MNAIPFGTGGLVFIGLYLLSMIWIGWLGMRAGRQENTLRDHFIGGQGVGFFVLLLTLFATQYSGNTILGFSGKAYRIGFRLADERAFHDGDRGDVPAVRAEAVQAGEKACVHHADGLSCSIASIIAG
jgi:hypothetical protein